MASDMATVPPAVALGKRPHPSVTCFATSLGGTFSPPSACQTVHEVFSCRESGVPLSSRVFEARALCPWRCLESSPTTLQEWGLPDTVVSRYAARGVCQLYPWQRACLFEYYHTVAVQLRHYANVVEAATQSMAGTTVNSGGGAACHRSDTPATLPGPNVFLAHPGRSMIYSAPTSGGKTLVAEVILLRSIFQRDRYETNLHWRAVFASGDPSASCATGNQQHQPRCDASSVFEQRKKTALFVVPYVSLAEEKAKQLEELFEGTGIRVQCHAGTRGNLHIFAGDIHVCTNEKAYAMWRVLEDQGKTTDISVVVVDELHLIADESRGYILELLLTRLAAHAAKHTDFHLICLSATLANADVLAKWCGGAQLFLTDYRPVQLAEYYVVSCMVYDPSTKLVRSLLSDVNTLRSVLVQSRHQVRAAADCTPVGGVPMRRTGYTVEEELSLLLALEAFRDGYQVLLFAPTRKACEVLSRQLAECVLANLFTPAARYAVIQAEGARAAAQLRDSGRATREILESTMSCGVAFHHAHVGLRDRWCLETAYRAGHLWALCCTTTLSTGVNLPCHRVIFTAPRIGRTALGPVQYRHAAGRAGRAGMVGHGEVFVIAKPQERSLVQSLFGTVLPPVVSNFSPERHGMARILLEGVERCPKRALPVASLAAIVSRTLYAQTHATSEVQHTTRVALEYLERKNFLVYQSDRKVIELTPLGFGTARSFLAPDEALLVRHELQLSSRRFCLANDLHLLFHCTPVFPVVEPDWRLLCHRWVPALLRNENGAAVCEALGINEGMLSSLAQCPPSRTSLDLDAIRCRRLYAALVLTEVVHEHPMESIAQEYGLGSATEVHRLMEAAAFFAASVSAFAMALNWWYLPPLLDTMVVRLRCGVEPDLLPLMEIDGLVPWRARQLQHYGYRTVLSVASASVRDLAEVFAHQHLGGYALQDDRHPGEDAFSVAAPSAVAMDHRRVVLTIAQRVKDAAKAVVLRDAGNLRAVLESITETEDPVTSIPGRNEATLVPSPALNTRGGGGGAHKLKETACDDTGPVPPTQPLPSPLPPTPGADAHHPTPRLPLAGPRDERQFALMPGQSPHSVPPLHVRMVNLDDVAERSAFEASFQAALIGAVRGPPAALKEGGASRKPPPLVSLFVVPRKQKNDLVVVVTVYPENLASSRTGSGDCGILTYGLYHRSTVTAGVSLRPETAAPVGGDSGEEKQVRLPLPLGAAPWGSRWLLKVLGTNAIEKIVPGLQRQLHVLHEAGWIPQPQAPSVCLRLIHAVHDPFIAAWMLQPDVDCSGKGCYEFGGLLPCCAGVETSAEAHLSACIQLQDAHGRALHRNTRNVLRYFTDVVRTAVLQSAAVVPLTMHLLMQLRAQSLYAPYYTREMRMPLLCYAMEVVGLGFRPHVYTVLQAAMREKASQIVARAYTAAGRSNWSLKAPQQVAQVLYDDLGLSCLEHTGDRILFPIAPRKRVRAQRETRSTRVPALKHLQRMFPDQPLPALLMEFGRLDGWDEKYLKPLLQASAAHRDGRIHGSFLLTASATGRLAMTDPNLQTIPRPILLELHGRNVDVRLREAFAVNQPGWVLLSADYAQMEVRLLAHFSEDAALLAAFTPSPPPADDTTGCTRSSGCSRDIFTELAAKLFRKETVVNTITAEQRHIVKALCYGIIYGRGKHSIADELEITVEAADQLLRQFRDTYRTAMMYISCIVAESLENGYVTTLLGRRRWLTRSKSPTARSAAERMAISTLCQGSAADIMKEAMLRIMSDALLQPHISPELVTDPSGDDSIVASLDGATGEQFSPAAHMLLQIHDELLLEVRESALHAVARRIREHMDLSNVLSLRVPLVVRFQVGCNWASLQPFEPS